jgi:hypothetical protein
MEIASILVTANHGNLEGTVNILRNVLEALNHEAPMIPTSKVLGVQQGVQQSTMSIDEISSQK